MLTVMEALKLKSLNRAKLIAGEKGKERSIKWITTIEIIDDITRFQEGEFVVTTGYGISNNTYYQQRMVELLDSKKPSAIAIFTSFYLDTIPKTIVNAANRNNIPLIEISAAINFSTITKEIVEQIGNEQMKLLEESLKIHKEMTKLAMNNSGLQEVLAKISPLTESSLFVYDDLGHLQASHNIYPSITIENEQMIFINNEGLTIHKILEKIKRTQDAYVFQYGSFYCYGAPIKDDTFAYGFLFAFHEKALWTNMDEIIMDHVATLIGIELVKQYAVEETKIRLQGELVEKLLMKEQMGIQSAMERGKKLGFDLGKDHAVLYFKVNVRNKASYENNNDFSTQLHYVVSQIFIKTKRQTILLPKWNALYALVEVNIDDKIQEKEHIRTLANEVFKRWIIHFKEELYIGIGNPYDDINHLSMSAKEAEYAVQYAPLLLKENFIVHFDDLGFYQILIRMQQSGISLEQFYKTYLSNLLQKNNYHADLLHTLEAFLAHNCNIQQTASKLYIHRHTLKYRLSQIEKRTGFHLQSPDDRLNLHLAILAYKFVQLQKQH